MLFKTKGQGKFHTIGINTFDMSRRAKIGAKSGKVRVDILMSNHYHVVMSLGPVQPPMFGCYTLSLLSNLPSVSQLSLGDYCGHSKSKMKS